MKGTPQEPPPPEVISGRPQSWEPHFLGLRKSRHSKSLESAEGRAQKENRKIVLPSWRQRGRESAVFDQDALRSKRWRQWNF